MYDRTKLDALFIGAHPDDIEITSSGTLLKMLKAGKKTGIIDLTLGELSTRGNLKTRKKETETASRILGIKVRENLGLPDGDIQNNQKNRIKLIRLIRKYKPGIIFAPFYDDRHPDHINTSNLVRESVYYSGLKKIETEELKPYRPSKIFYFRHAYDLPISFIVDISDVFKIKMRSIKAYKSQFYDPKTKQPDTYISSKLFLKDIETRARFYGFKIGVEFGEPFYSEEPIKIHSENLNEL
ncbi:MAG: bacillithiol biosynthesis deacetylase BshB1 [Ignavibacteria bacterium]|nr:bacillithiol biosynthesis deacetylase BshB1 [Ignavibacteria bacterium]